MMVAPPALTYRKRCSRCGLIKAEGYFHHNFYEPDHLAKVCAACVNARNKMLAQGPPLLQPMKSEANQAFVEDFKRRSVMRMPSSPFERIAEQLYMVLEWIAATIEARRDRP